MLNVVSVLLVQTHYEGSFGKVPHFTQYQKEKHLILMQANKTFLKHIYPFKSLSTHPNSRSSGCDMIFLS